MSFSIAICGLPNVGKSTLFSALTKKEVKISPVPFSTIDPNIARVAIEDSRLEKISLATGIPKIVPAFVEFYDIAGLVKNAHRGEGMGNQFLSHIRQCNAILLLARAFENEKVRNYLGEINPEKEFNILETELMMKDLETIEKCLKSTKKQKEKEILFFLREEIAKGKKISQVLLSPEEKEIIKGFQFLTQKPFLYVVNGSLLSFSSFRSDFLFVNAQEELEISSLSEEEQKELGVVSRLEQLIKASYNILELISFFTIAHNKEVKAWTIKKNSNILEGAKKIHSDFKEKFIKAEIVNWEELIKTKNWKELHKMGKIKIVGRDYILQEGDIVEFKI